MTRTITHRYDDPVDLIWLACAQRLGYTIARSAEVYASFDGEHTLTISTADDFDPDDSIAQLIFHELCHAIVSAPAGLRQEDWGLDNTTERDLVQEHATHRLQAHLTDRFGLRALLSVTTGWRPYWDTLGPHPLEEPADDPAIPIARRAAALADREPWASALRDALRQTAAIAAVVRTLAPPTSLWAHVSPRVSAPHPLGQRLGPPGTTCAECAWAHREPDGTTRCEMFRRGEDDAPSIDPAGESCQFFEPRLDDQACADCGACCHRAFDVVLVQADEVVAQRHRQLLTPAASPSVMGAPYVIDRPGGYCRALARTPGASPARPFRCTIYADRPQSCRDFEVGSRNCLEARRRVGISPRLPLAE